ncbi:DUF3489 domain-containing protein [Methylobacterium sp. J-076]|uniref:DUF3489 domain-containing protein n=1 Tax=Methylobacterium sp. J-076 TaxID=2836655 RepID=UPI001FB8D90D|nr:DUF3489 domain-containing protein [Methylobacterium sp. J-076]MCJ2011556.1 DUF3489 domain-containing protein [Methylobacterium sp. J-076]
MTTLSLTRTEADILHAAAAAEGRLQFAPAMKPASRKQLLGRFLRDALITSSDAPDGQHRLTPAGYRAIGLTPPPVSGAASRPNKKALVLTLLARDEGATLAELIGATSWLPHTTRAALSRIRSSGQPLAKATRPDATTAYRILPAPPPPAARARSRRKGATPDLTATAGIGAELPAGALMQATT